MSIAAAVRAYYTEYGKYPLGAQATQGTATDILFGDTQNGMATVSNQALFDILRNVQTTPGQPNQYNPRAIIFFDGKAAADQANPKSGFATQAGASSSGVPITKGAYFDPWGREYCIAIDGDYDNTISILPYTDFKTGSTPGPPMTGVAVFSLGKDGALGTKVGGGTGDGYYRNPAKTTSSDDIISWQ
jgi:hypothetical protein